MEKDIQKVLVTQEQIQAKVQEFAKIFSEEYKDKDPIFVGVLKGVVMFFADVFRNVTVPCEMDFMCISSYGGTSTTGGAASILGTILGSMILVIIRQGLNLAMASSTTIVINATNITYAVTGVIVVGAVLLDVLKKKSAAKVKIPPTEKAKAKAKAESKS